MFRVTLRPLFTTAKVQSLRTDEQNAYLALRGNLNSFSAMFQIT